MTIADRIKELREKNGLTQKELADASGVPLGTIREYEQGVRRRDPPLGVALKLAVALGVSVEMFAEAVQKPARKRK